MRIRRGGLICLRILCIVHAYDYSEEKGHERKGTKQKRPSDSMTFNGSTIYLSTLASTVMQLLSQSAYNSRVSPKNRSTINLPFSSHLYIPALGLSIIYLSSFFRLTTSISFRHYSHFPTITTGIASLSPSPSP